jgi:hypothetical protein
MENKMLSSIDDVSTEIKLKNNESKRSFSKLDSAIKLPQL